MPTRCHVHVYKHRGTNGIDAAYNWSKYIEFQRIDMSNQNIVKKLRWIHL